MPYRIVVADKDPRTRETVTRSLEQDNEFVSVTSSAELKQAIKEEKPHLIILSTILADSPNWGAVQRVVKGIKSSRDYSDIPVLLMSSEAGGPSPDEIQTFGADGYLTKPIDRNVLRQTVESLLGLGSESADEEIMIDFADDDSGDMTEELLAMSNIAMEREEPSTDVGDTVEIDTGTLVAELDHSGEMGGEDTYEDTVRLNLEDMGLEDDLEDGTAFEPTIELVSDVGADFGDGAQSEVEEIELEMGTEEEELLPDFASAGKDAQEPLPAGKDSITVEMDVDEMGLELEAEGEEASEEFSTGKIEGIDLDDTEIGEILDVQEPSKILTSEDLLLDDDSLIREPSEEVDVIDLEDDTEIRDMDMEELDSIQASSVESIGIDLDETVPVESLDSELGQEDLGELDLDEAEDEGEEDELELEAPLETAQQYDSDELTLEEMSEEEISTQEFFGEELPTEEFPTEKYPDEKTRDHAEEISLDDFGTEEISLEAPGPLPEEISLEDVALDTSLGEDMLFEQAPEEEPMLEVTEDISLEEISLEEEPEPTLSEEPMREMERPIPEAARPAPSPDFSVVESAAVAAAGALAGAGAAALAAKAGAPEIPQPPMVGVCPGFASCFGSSDSSHCGAA